MTYSYIISVPLIVIYSVSMAIMKYQAGYVSFPNPGSTAAHPLPRIVVPAPTSFWPEAHQKLIFPLYILFALAWALEIVSHLEELCFWLFMIKEQGEANDGGVRPWFKSFEYKLWCCGSVGAMVLLPLVTLETRHNVQQIEAWTFFTGSVGSLLVTLWFFKVLWEFPSFLKRIRDENAEPEVIVRLVAFQDLNRLRIVFRLLFVLPLLVLACDGLKPNGPHRIMETAGAVDVLAMIGGIGCIVSSVITLLIFFPRSIAREAGYATRVRTRSTPAQSKSGAPRNINRQNLTINTQHSRSAHLHSEIQSTGSPHHYSRPGTEQRSTGTLGEIRVEPRSPVSVQRPPVVHRRTTSSGSPRSDPLTPMSGRMGGVQVTVHTSVRGDSSYFGRSGTVTLGDEELPAYVGEGLSPDCKHPYGYGYGRQLHPSSSASSADHAEDCFSASGPSVIRSGSASAAPLVRAESGTGRPRSRQGLHPLLVNYTSPIDLHEDDDAIGRAL
ncbi:Transmembrane protein [Ceratobasidium theobromae]|uniref:Transmembrane protein n=1 Tax=Ceratobasidium theobromae TaxID=1582974 RepID=A0A5N5QD24_9AGAM|nr:Transmembrane protein [Ceratobasidium theobromae]